MNELFLSCLVDANPKFYYQTELLLFSLSKNTSIPKSNVIVQCTETVDRDFISRLRSQGYSTTSIEKYLDGKYCNKIGQLEYFVDKQCDVVLVDTDIYFCNDLDISERDNFAAATVDASNPDLRLIQSVFESANLALPELIKPTWSFKGDHTIRTNFNGGFYYIPQQRLSRIRSEWEKWASWLYERRDLIFADGKGSMHIDQISMAMTIQELGYQYNILPANYNCPTHKNLKNNNLQSGKQIVALHYHNELDNFGLLKSKSNLDEEIRDEVKIANKDIVNKFSPLHLEDFRGHLYSERTNDLIPDREFEAGLAKLVDQFGNRDLIIHAGTPKTGTTSLQHFLNSSSPGLAIQGFIYDFVNDKKKEPKHQWLVLTLRQKRKKVLVKYLNAILNKSTHSTDKIILSTEGFYNHWSDFDKESLGMIASLNKYFKLRVVTYFRNPVGLSLSLYRQYLKNVQSPNNTVHGKDLSLSDMISDSWFRSKLDYQTYLAECSSIIGSERMEVVCYKPGHTVKQFLKLIDAKLDLDKIPHKNKSLGYLETEWLRIVNRLNLKKETKDKFISELRLLKSKLPKEGVEKMNHEQDLDLVNKLTLKFNKRLKVEYGLTFS